MCEPGRALGERTGRRTGKERFFGEDSMQNIDASTDANATKGENGGPREIGPPSNKSVSASRSVYPTSSTVASVVRPAMVRR